MSNWASSARFVSLAVYLSFVTSDLTFISPSAKANLLSFSLVSKLFEITWDQDEQMFIVTTPQEKLFFRNVDDLFVCDVRRYIIKLNQSQSYLSSSKSKKFPTMSVLKLDPSTSPHTVIR